MQLLNYLSIQHVNVTPVLFCGDKRKSCKAERCTRAIRDVKCCTRAIREVERRNHAIHNVEQCVCAIRKVEPREVKRGTRAMLDTYLQCGDCNNNKDLFMSISR